MSQGSMFTVTTVAILIGIFFNWQEAKSIRKEMREDRSEVLAAIERLRTETRSAIDTLRADMTALHERVAKVEVK